MAMMKKVNKRHLNTLLPINKQLLINSTAAKAQLALAYRALDAANASLFMISSVAPAAKKSTYDAWRLVSKAIEQLEIVIGKIP